MINKKIMFCIAFMGGCSLIFVSVLNDIEESNMQDELYCEMVTTYQETQGDYGWPDYQNNYNEVCPK